jgi:hypothetical protein
MNCSASFSPDPSRPVRPTRAGLDVARRSTSPSEQYNGFQVFSPLRLRAREGLAQRQESGTVLLGAPTLLASRIASFSGQSFQDLGQ